MICRIGSSVLKLLEVAHLPWGTLYLTEIAASFGLLSPIIGQKTYKYILKACKTAMSFIYHTWQNTFSFTLFYCLVLKQVILQKHCLLL